MVRSVSISPIMDLSTKTLDLGVVDSNNFGAFGGDNSMGGGGNGSNPPPLPPPPSRGGSFYRGNRGAVSSLLITMKLR